MTQQRSLETRNQILISAFSLFSKNGYTATGVAEICHTAGISKGAFYHHFPSKQAVFLAILDEWLDELDLAITAVRQSGIPADQIILQMASVAGNAVQKADIRLTIILEFWMQAARDPLVWAAATAPYERYLTYIAEIIDQGIAEGSLREVDSRQAAYSVVAMGMGMLMQAIFESQKIDWGQTAPQIVNVLLSGLRKESV